MTDEIENVEQADVLEDEGPYRPEVPRREQSSNQGTSEAEEIAFRNRDRGPEERYQAELAPLTIELRRRGIRPTADRPEIQALRAKCFAPEAAPAEPEGLQVPEGPEA